MLFFFYFPVPDPLIFVSGCQYIVPKEYILNKPIQFFKRLHAMTLNTPIISHHDAHYESNVFDINSVHGWLMERLLLYIFSNVPVTSIMKQKRYLITGGAGFIGSTLVNKLSIDNSIIVIDNLSTGYIKNINMNDNIHFIDGNILDNDILYLAGCVDGIFHLAAMSKVLKEQSVFLIMLNPINQ